jgi:hypothetical protein
MVRVATRNNLGQSPLWTTIGSDSSSAQFSPIPLFKAYGLAMMQLLQCNLWHAARASCVYFIVIC